MIDMSRGLESRRYWIGSGCRSDRSSGLESRRYWVGSGRNDRSDGLKGINLRYRSRRYIVVGHCACLIIKVKLYVSSVDCL